MTDEINSVKIILLQGMMCNIDVDRELQSNDDSLEVTFSLFV